MSWWTWVVDISGTESPKTMQAKTGIDGPNFSKWKAGQVPRAETVAKFARGYDVPVLSAFVAAGFLTEKEARMRPTAAPSLSSLDEVDLIKEVLRRAEERSEHGGNTAATNTGVPADVRELRSAAARTTGKLSKQQQRDRAGTPPQAVDPDAGDPDDYEPR